MDASTIYSKAFSAGLLPDPDILLSDWADRNFILPDTAKEKGKLRISRTPYLREPLDVLSPSCPITEVCCIKGTQLAWTTLAEIFTAGCIDIAPGPILFVMPTGDMAKEHSKDRLEPSFEAIACLKGKIRESKSRDRESTILHKRFPGGSLKLVGSNSPKSFRSKSIRYLILDDCDGYPASVGEEGDPSILARKRTDQYGTKKKIFENSTPTLKGFSRIERSFEESDQRYYHVPCPECGQLQKLIFGGKGADFGLKFEHQDLVVLSVWYECRFCHAHICENHKTAMLAGGEWIPEKPERSNIKRGYHLNSLYSPLGWVSWKQIVEEFIAARDDSRLLQVWTNTRLAETWEERGAQPDWAVLRNRADQYQQMEIPRGGLMLTAGVDTQDDRLAVTIWAWGRGEESWLIFWGELFGDPSLFDVWEQLDGLLNRPFLHSSGVELHVLSTAVDSAGHKTQEVYNYCRSRQQKVIAIKGSSQPNRPILGRPSDQEVTWRGQKIPNGIQLWPVGSDTAKTLLYGRLNIKPPGPGAIHFPIGLDDDFYMQLTAERKITRYDKGFPVQTWELPSGRRNEVLDSTVYAYAAAIRVGLLRLNWDELEKSILNPPERIRNREINAIPNNLNNRRINPWHGR